MIDAHADTGDDAEHVSADESDGTTGHSDGAVRVPLRRGPGPFDRGESTVVPADAAAHWSDRVWHVHPPG